MNQEKYNITDAEWKIMRVLWKYNANPKGLSLGYIRESLESECSWNVNTIRTLLVRLIEKDIVRVDKKDRNHRYYPLVSQEECVIQETESLLTKIFEGSPSLLFSTLIRNGKVSEKEQEEIISLIHKMRGDNND